VCPFTYTQVEVEVENQELHGTQQKLFSTIFFFTTNYLQQNIYNKYLFIGDESFIFF